MSYCIMNENRVCTKQSLRGSKGHRLTGWSEQQNMSTVSCGPDSLYNSIGGATFLISAGVIFAAFVMSFRLLKMK
jgi:hypothetical protein